MQASEWSGLVARARREHAAGGGTVLDIIVRHARVDAATVYAELERSAGIHALHALGVSGLLPAALEVDVADRARATMRQRDGNLVAVLVDPWDEALMRRLKRLFGPDFLVCAAHAEEFAALAGAAGAAHSHASAATNALSPQVDDGPIVSFVDVAVLQAIDRGASDIHFECDRHGVTARHRLDGVMVVFAKMNGVRQAQEVISRIKVLAQLDITERRRPQDGRFRLESQGQSMDLRVSIMPSVHGEDAVLRLLDKAQWRGEDVGITLGGLGFDDTNTCRILSIAREPSGMLLVTGPTGSGKTTTLYAVLSTINTGSEKIVTIEDPVEYELQGALQIPVNERKGLTFATGLRSILRHDPDRILVGEIRDAETAEIAVQASLTGHQVFTTVHANSLSDIIGRFRHFGLDMFGLASSLNGVVVQRLLRMVCRHCAVAMAPDERYLAACIEAGVAVPEAILKPQGCGTCHSSGYSGRFVIAEVYMIDDHFRDLVTDGAPTSAVKQYARTLSGESLRAAGLRQVAVGRTTLEELDRVVGTR